MAGEKYIELGHLSMFNFFESNFETYLTAVEVAQSLATGTMAAPVDYIPRQAPEDNRNPLVMVYETDFDLLRNESQRAGRWVVGVDTLIQWESDADLDEAKRTTQRYLTAIVDTIRSDATLGSAVVQATFAGYDIAPQTIDDAVTKHMLAVAWDVIVES